MTIETDYIDQKVRLGVIGAGWFASRRHMPDAMAHPRTLLAAFCRRDAGARETLCKRFEVLPEHAYADYEEMLERESLDAVLIATPNNLHYAQAKAALEQGLHVLIEKPMTIRSEDADELVSLAKSKNLKLAVAVNPPYWSHCHRIRDVFLSGEIGELECAALFWTGNAEYVFGQAPAPENLPGVVLPTMYRSDPAQNGGGYFMDGGPHLISELLFVTGLKVQRVTALMDVTPMDMRVSLSLEMENGALVTLVSLGDSKSGGRRVRNTFGASNGTITVDDFAFDTTVLINGKEAVTFCEADTPPPGTPIGNFVEAILGETELLSTGEHGAEVVRVIEAAYRSATEGRTIAI